VARTIINPQLLPQANTLTGAALTFQPADIINFNNFFITGNQILVVCNTAVSTGTFTVTTAPDTEGRTGTMGPITVAAFSSPLPGFYISQRFPTNGFQQSDGTVWLAGSAVTILFAVVQLLY
jgi:hypothetical protein